MTLRMRMRKRIAQRCVKLRKTQAEQEAQEEKEDDEKRQNEKEWKEYFPCGVRGLRANSVLGFVHFLRKPRVFLSGETLPSLIRLGRVVS